MQGRAHRLHAFVVEQGHLAARIAGRQLQVIRVAGMEGRRHAKPAMARAQHEPLAGRAGRQRGPQGRGPAVPQQGPQAQGGQSQAQKSTALHGPVGW